MEDGYLSLEEAARFSGFHPNSIKRILCTGQIYGYKEMVGSRRQWRVSRRSLERYCNAYEFGFDRPGPKPTLSRLNP